MRTICPQVKGIYENNESPDDAEYGYLLIVNDEPNRELVATDAYQVNLAGEVNPDHQHPSVCLPQDFGDFVDPNDN